MQNSDVRRVDNTMWTCDKCGEEIEDQFDACWRCAGEPDWIGLPLGARGKDTLGNPKKKQSLVALGGLLILGGIIVLRQAGRFGRFYERLDAEGSVSWASGLGGLMIVGGGVLLLAGLAIKSGNKD